MKSTFAALTLASALSLVSASAQHHARDQQGVLAQRRALKGFERRRLAQRDEAVAGVSYLAVANASDASASADPRAVANATTAEPAWVEATALWFAQDGVAEGACKQVHTDEDLVIGLSTDYIDSWSTISPYCGQSVYIEDLASGKNLTLLVTDSSGNGYTTLSKAAFSYFAPLVNGELKVRYYFLDAATTNATAPSTNVAEGNSTVPTHQTSSRTAPTAPVATDVKPTVKPTPTADDNEASAAAAAAASSKSAAAAAAAASSKSAQAAKAQASADAAAAKQAQAEAAAAAEAQKQKEAAAQKEQEAQAAAAAAAKQKQQEQAAAAAAAAAAQKQKEQEQAAAAAAAASKAAAEAAQAQATQSSGGGGGGKVFSGGFATYFLQNGVAGNCGAVSQDSDKVIALPTSTYAGGSHCGAMIKITRVDNGATVVARVADSCPTCVNSVSLDLSVGAFTAIATESEGMVPITWQWA